MMRNMVNSKYILSCLSAFVLAICTCASACLHSDGFICSKRLKAESCKTGMEFFYSNGKDTSAISFIYDSVRGKGITIDVLCSVSEKEFEWKEESDTNALANNSCISHRSDRFKIPSYKQLMFELGLSLGEAAKYYSIENVETIYARLADFDDVAIKVSSELSGKRGCYTHSDIDRCIQKSSLVKDLNVIFNRYGLATVRVRSGEEIYIIPAETYKANKKTKENSIPDSIIDVSFVVRLSTATNEYQQ